MFSLRTPKLSDAVRAKSLIRRVWSFLKKLLKKLMELAKSGGALNVAQRILAYVITASISTYGLTAATTPASFLNPAQVMPIVERAGVINWATFGAGAPLLNFGRSALGELVSLGGQISGNSQLLAFGNSLESQAKSWFKQGLGTFNLDGSPIDFGALKMPVFDFGNFIAFWDNERDSDENPQESFDDAAVSPIDNADLDAAEAISPEEVAGRRWTQFDIERFPNYYRIIDEPVKVDVSVPAGSIQYGGIDELGRTMRAVGNITYNMVAESSGWRAAFKADADQISGWGNNAKASIPLYNGDVYNGWFWNRSHLIADSLGGFEHVYTPSGELDQAASASERRNLICGTRMQNVGTNNAGGSGYGGMAYFERMVVDYLEGHQECSIWYSADPIYEGDELIPRSVIVKAKSCDGGLNVQAEVFNAAYGYEIDYSTGEFWPAGSR